MRAYRKVAFGTNTRIESEPTLQEGKAGVSYALEIEAKNKKTQAALPSTISFNVQYARGSLKTYLLDADVDITIDRSGDKPRVLFSLVFPGLEVVQDQAVSDEVAWFREEVKDLDGLLILENY